MALMLNPEILKASKNFASKPDAQAKAIAGKLPQTTSLRELNKIGTDLTTLAQAQKKSGSPDIRVTNSLISELSNIASVGSVQSKALLRNLSTGISDSLKSIIPDKVSNSPSIFSGGLPQQRKSGIFTATQPRDTIQTHTQIQESVITERTQPNLENSPVVDDGSLGDLFGSFGIDPTTVVNADGEFSLSEFAKNNPLVVAGGLGLLLLLLTRRGKR